MKDRCQKNVEKLPNSSIPPSSSTVSQVQPTQQSVELGTVEFDALLAFGRDGHLKNANLKPLVPNAKTVDVPEQNLDPVTPAIEEQEQVARQRVLVKRLLGHAHQSIEAEIHPDGRCANKDS